MTHPTTDRLHKLMFDIHEVAQITGVSTGTVYNAVKRGEIKAVRIGRRILVPGHQLRTMLGLGESPRSDRAA